MANEILTFCGTDNGTNLLTEAEYLASGDRTSGNKPGVASSKLVNKALRQSAFVTSQFAQLISDQAGVNVVDDGNTATLLAQIKALFNVFQPVGGIQPYMGVTAPTGWLLMNSQTIGNASSGGTARANADTATLFALLWDSVSNTNLPIQDSAGVATTRGANAAADFAANKRMPLPDARNVFLAGANASTRTIGGIVYPAVVIGATVTDQFQGHYHAKTDPGHTHSFNAVTGTFSTSPNPAGSWVVGNATSNSTNSNTTGITVTAPSTDGSNGTPRTGTTTFPVNLGVTYIIKY